MFRNFENFFNNVNPDDEAGTIEEIAQRVVREGLGAAMIVFLESMKPISFLSGQAAIMATPLLGGFISPLRLEKYADRFSDRRFIERLIQRIEELEEERAGERKREGETKSDTDK